MQRDRYSRQRLFAAIGDDGQRRLGSARVTLIGCGALGTHIAQHLARAGIGYLRICDRDFVELDNLQRQVLYDEEDARAALPKAIAAENKLRRINSEIELDCRVTDVTPRNILTLIEGTDLVIDGTDNFETRYLINDACVHENRPWIYGGVVASHGMVLTVRPGQGPCFACVVPEMPPPGSTGTCDTAGVIGPAVAIVAALESAEALKILVGADDRIAPGLTTLDPWRNQHDCFSMPRNPKCRVCVERDFRYLRAEAGASSTVLCGRNAVQITPESNATIDLEQVQTRLSTHGTVRCNEYLLRFRADSLELTLFPDGRAVIKGTDEAERARSFYAKYIGS